MSAELESGHKLGNGHFKCSGKHLQIANADFLLPVLQVRNKTTVHAHVLGHVDLCPLPLLAEGAQPLPEPNTDIAGHAPNYGCRLSPINRL